MILRGQACLEKLLRDYEFRTVVDYGCGSAGREPHRGAFLKAGKLWHGFDLDGWHGFEIGLADCLWASHVLEHSHAPIKLLAEWRRAWLRRDGILAVTVPCLKHAIVGGHVNLYNAGLLLYQLVLAGYDCSEASVRTTAGEISVIVRSPGRRVELPELKHDRGDIERLAHLFPPPCRQHGFEGRIDALNWSAPCTSP